MPILGQEPDMFPADLLTQDSILNDPHRQWYCVYTISRREKDLMRKLYAGEIPFYGPIIEKRYRAASGRLRTSYVPLFPNYVFMCVTEEDRYQAMTTNCISKCSVVEDARQLVDDLKKISTVIATGVGLTPEARLDAGHPVRVKAGPFAGYEGTVIRREGKTRLLLSVKFLEQGISIGMDEGLVEPI
ncbi:MAG: transcription termination/antitermination NusG family protein [Planctomycetota bacterium]